MLLHLLAMKIPLSNLSPTNHSLSTITSLRRGNFIPNPNFNSTFALTPFLTLSPKPQVCNRLNLIALCSSNSLAFSRASKPSLTDPMEKSFIEENEQANQWRVEIRNLTLPPAASTWVSSFSPGDRAFFLLAFIACTTSAAFTSFVIAAVPTLSAVGRTATSLSKLADTACEELPGTMAAIRLSSMEISDLTLELSDLSQEVLEGISKSAQAVQAAEAGIKQIGALAHQQTISMIEERANLPIISLQPVVSGAARKTSHAVGTATRTIMSIISRGKSDLARSNDDRYEDEEADTWEVMEQFNSQTSTIRS